MSDTTAAVQPQPLIRLCTSEGHITSQGKDFFDAVLGTQRTFEAELDTVKRMLVTADLVMQAQRQQIADLASAVQESAKRTSIFMYTISDVFVASEICSEEQFDQAIDQAKQLVEAEEQRALEGNQPIEPLLAL